MELQESREYKAAKELERALNDMSLESSKSLLKVQDIITVHYSRN